MAIPNLLYNSTCQGTRTCIDKCNVVKVPNMSPGSEVNKTCLEKSGQSSVSENSRSLEARCQMKHQLVNN